MHLCGANHFLEKTQAGRQLSSLDRKEPEKVKAKWEERGGERRGEDGDQKNVFVNLTSCDVFDERCPVGESENVGDSFGCFGVGACGVFVAACCY